MKKYLAFGLLAALPTLSAAAPPPAETQAGEQEIVVRGKREREAQIKGFIDALAPSRFNGQVARFSTEACPGTLGVVPRQAEVITARLRKIAAAVGVPLAKEGCKPNVWVVVTDDREALATRVRGSWRSGPDGRPEKGRPDDLATVLHAEQLLDANGEQMGVKADRGDGDSGSTLR